MTALKKWTWIIAGAATLIGLTLVGGYAYGGGFQALRVETQTLPDLPLAGLDYTGPYESMFPTYEKAGQMLDSLGIPTASGLGWYFDDPSEVKPEQCRGFYGRILSAPLDSAARHQLQASGLRTDTVPGGTALVVAYKASNPLAYMIGALRAYPLLTQAYQDGRWDEPVAVYERYDEGTTYYTFVFNAR